MGRWLIATLAAVVLVLAGSIALVGATGGSTPPPGMVRFARFTPGDPLDVYVDGVKTATLAFQQVSPYVNFTGSHAVTYLPAGAAVNAPPLAGGSVDVTSGQTLTVTVIASSVSASGLQLVTYTDDLSPPPLGQAKLRVINAIATVPMLTVTATPSPAGAQNPPLTIPSIPYPTATGYASVPAGAYDVAAGAQGETPTVVGQAWPLMANTVTTVVAIISPSGAPTIEILDDIIPTYTVVPGDCLWTIAARLMGDGSKWPVLYHANLAAVGRNPNLIHPGLVLTLPVVVQPM